jgi:hypothetical protein
MNRLIKIALSISLIFGVQSAFACEYPDRVLVPNGNTATKEEMVAGQRGVKKYVADMEIYLECIVQEEKAARDAIGDLEANQEQEREDMLNKKYNAAVDEMERLAAQFNAEVQAYKAKEEG